VILRVWRAKIVPERVGEYRRFNREQSLPMLRKQPGFLGVLFSWAARDCTTISVTIWEDVGALQALQSSPSYRKTTRRLAESGLLASEKPVELLEARAESFARRRLWGRSRRRSPERGAQVLRVHPRQIPSIDE
jgi:heme-degrading monooxygenase HmoA